MGIVKQDGGLVGEFITISRLILTSSVLVVCEALPRFFIFFSNTIFIAYDLWENLVESFNLAIRNVKYEFVKFFLKSVLHIRLSVHGW